MLGHVRECMGQRKANVENLDWGKVVAGMAWELKVAEYRDGMGKLVGSLDVQKKLDCLEVEEQEKVLKSVVAKQWWVLLWCMGEKRTQR